MRPAADPRPEETGPVGTGPPSVTRRDDEGHIRLALADVGEADVAIALDVHLADVSHTRHPSEVGDKGDATWPERGVHEAQSAGDDGMETIGADYHSRLERRVRLPSLAGRR